MALKNSKQIPLCPKCHMALVHGGKYNGPKLIKLAPTQKLIDNRMIQVASFVKPGVDPHVYTKTKNLEQKGWKQIFKQTIQNQNQTI
jgi:hypothetical protein